MKKRILVIDDEKAIRNSFTLTFEDSDYYIDTAENGKQGLHKFKENKYCLVFLDLKMPDMHGAEVLKQLRVKDTKTPVYIITAFHKEFFEELNEARSRGIHFELLNKPLKSTQLKNLVECVLNGKCEEA